VSQPPRQIIIPPPPADTRPIPAAPIHPLAALVTIVLDQMWGVPEIALLTFPVFGWIFDFVAVFLLGGLALTAVTLIQHYVSGDSWRAAFAKGFAMGILAGVPFVVGGTLVGTLLLGWSGLSRISGLLK
jgi:hypothetical protein